MKPEDVPFQPWAEADYRRRVEGQSKDDPTAQCQPTGIPGLNTYPQPFKILQLPALMVILYENDTDFRQIFLDGRAHPDDPQPTWMGYSVGRWDAGTLVVETIGFAGRSWLDRTGHPRTEAMRVTERFRRLDFGRMEIEITIDDRALFVDAERATRFLRFIVDLTLDGRASEIKESVIAIEVLGRTASFDSKTDPIVRVEAGRLRERLREYYDQAGNADDVLISVPKGGYVPEFAEREPLTQQQNPLRLSVLPPDGADVESFVVSPDGRQIAFAGRVNGRPMLRATLS